MRSTDWSKARPYYISDTCLTWCGNGQWAAPFARTYLARGTKVAYQLVVVMLVGGKAPVLLEKTGAASVG